MFCQKQEIRQQPMNRELHRFALSAALPWSSEKPPEARI
jgi:hypothetical protein